MKVHIPETVEGLRKDLGGLERLLVAKRWEKAAIVYAWTEPGEQGDNGHTKREENRPLPIKTFARLGIIGLKHPEEVREYRSAWESAHKDGQASLDIKPGDEVALPTLPWKEHFGEPTVDVQARVFRSVGQDPERFKAALRDHPAVATSIAQNVIDTPATRAVVAARLAEPIQPRHAASPPPTPPHDYRGELIRVAGLLSGLVRAMQTGQWEPTATESMLLHSLALLIGDAHVGADSDALFTDIERFLEAGVR